MRYFVVTPKHWWQWLSPSFLINRRRAQAFFDLHQERIAKILVDAYMRVVLFGFATLNWDEELEKMAHIQDLRNCGDFTVKLVRDNTGLWARRDPMKD